jgi:hypothetical protein
VLGMDARRERREIKSRIGVVAQETNLDGDLTVRENLTQQARYFGLDLEVDPPHGGATAVALRELPGDYRVHDVRIANANALFSMCSAIVG